MESTQTFFKNKSNINCVCVLFTQIKNIKFMLELLSLKLGDEYDIYSYEFNLWIMYCHDYKLCYNLNYSKNIIQVCI